VPEYRFFRLDDAGSILGPAKTATHQNEFLIATALMGLIGVAMDHRPMCSDFGSLLGGCRGTPSPSMLDGGYAHREMGKGRLS
jgi:hypothetical protein